MVRNCLPVRMFDDLELIYPENWEQHQVEVAIFRRKMGRKQTSIKQALHHFNEEI